LQTQQAFQRHFPAGRRNRAACSRHSADRGPQSRSRATGHGERIGMAGWAGWTKGASPNFPPCTGPRRARSNEAKSPNLKVSQKASRRVGGPAGHAIQYDRTGPSDGRIDVFKPPGRVVGGPQKVMPHPQARPRRVQECGDPDSQERRPGACAPICVGQGTRSLGRTDAEKEAGCPAAGFRNLTWSGLVFEEVLTAESPTHQDQKRFVPPGGRTWLSLTFPAVASQIFVFEGEGSASFSCGPGPLRFASKGAASEHSRDFLRFRLFLEGQVGWV